MTDTSQDRKSIETQILALESERLQFFDSVCKQAGWDGVRVTPKILGIITGKSTWKRLTKQIGELRQK